MFQIAAAEGLARDNGVKAIFPSLKSEKQWNVQENWKKIFFRVDDSSPTKGISKVYTEPYYHYKKIPYQKYMRIRGFFQSEKYFINHKEAIWELFAPSQEIVDYLNSKYRDIITHPRTVAIHFRDYSKEDPTHRAHPNVNIKYFKKAIKYYPKNSLFVVFSNNIAWCKQAFSGMGRSIKFIENEHYHHDFFLMSMCKHNIISNSSYSWWAAYLNRNPNKIVGAPKLWFNKRYRNDTYDNTPPSWIKIDY